MSRPSVTEREEGDCRFFVVNPVKKKWHRFRKPRSTFSFRGGRGGGSRAMKLCSGGAKAKARNLFSHFIITEWLTDCQTCSAVWIDLNLLNLLVNCYDTEMKDIMVTKGCMQCVLAARTYPESLYISSHLAGPGPSMFKNLGLDSLQVSHRYISEDLILTLTLCFRTEQMLLHHQRVSEWCHDPRFICILVIINWQACFMYYK